MAQMNLKQPGPTTFNHRIKRLLDLDKTLVESEETVESAFLTKLLLGQGNDRKFSSYDAFLLGLGLQLMDSGYSQGDIIFALQHLRSDLTDYYADVINYETQKSEPHKNALASQSTKTAAKIADLRAFIIFQRAELKEVYAFEQSSKRPVFYKPIITFGTEGLFHYLESDTMLYQTHLIIEFSYLARTLKKKLLAAPLSTRGIKPRKDKTR